MNRIAISLLVIFAALSLVLPAALPGLASTAALHITVTRAPFGAAVAGAAVSADGLHSTTDAAGRAVLALPPGTYDVRVEAHGYIGMTETRVQIAANQSTTLSLEMLPKYPSPQEDAEIAARIWAANEYNQADATDDMPDSYLSPSGVSEPPDTLRVLMPDGTVVVMPLEEYLKGVVPAEVPASWPAEALRAQAVAARSYAATRHSHEAQGADVCTTTHCQVWTTTQRDSTNSAIADTRGVVGRYAGQIIYAFFFAHCNGMTKRSEEIGWNPVPYCTNVICPCGYDFYYGHGVGMCQEGARAMALQGYSYKEIVEHYYTGALVNGPEPTPSPTPSPSPTPPVLTSGVSPTSGDTNTMFTYSATFAGHDGESPLLAYVVIDGQARSLVPAWSVAGVGASLAPDVATQEYVLRTRLDPGQHHHRFVFIHADGGISSLPEDGDALGPIVVLASQPSPLPTPDPIQAVDITASTVVDWDDGYFEGIAVSEEQDGELRLALDASEGVYTSPVLGTTLDHVAVGATWYACEPEGASVALEVRRGYSGGVWGAWTLLSPSEDDARALPASSAGRLYSSDLLYGQGDALQYRVTLRGPNQSPVLRHLRLVCIDSLDGPSAPRPVEPTGEPITRAEWGADSNLLHWPAEPATPLAFVLHHTNHAPAGVDPAACVRALYYYHSVIREWGDLGYNYVVDGYGNVYQGRAGGPNTAGAHSGELDALTQGIALLGDLSVLEPTAAQQDGTVALLARLCTANTLTPTGTVMLLNRSLPVIMGHSDAAAVTCPGSALSDRLPAMRMATLLKMGYESPQITLQNPPAGATLRGVVEARPSVTGPVTAVDYLIDGQLAATVTSAPYAWLWSTVDLPDGPHTLRAEARNELGVGSADVTVLLDNTVPVGDVSVPSWSAHSQVPFTIVSSDAATVQFSNNWVWEGETFYFGRGNGRLVVDSDALNGRALMGRAGLDAAGAWFGPYTCILPWPAAYEAVYRLKTTERTPGLTLAELDISDLRGTRRLGHLERLTADTLARDHAYDEVALPFNYNVQAPTCTDPKESDGLEFRTNYLGQQDLYLDRVTVFSAPTPLQSPITWTVRAVEGAQPVIVRLRDEAGNPTDQVVMVRLDWSPPRWLDGSGRVQRVIDTVSGLEPASAACAFSADGGATWSEWLALDPCCAPGTTAPILLVAPDPQTALGLAATHVKFTVTDLAGNVSTSPAQLLSEGAARDIALPMILR